MMPNWALARAATLLALLIVVASVRAAPFEPDANVLLQFKSSILAADQPILQGWSANNISNMCEWVGIKCNAAGRVTILDIRKIPVRGTVPASLAELAALEELHLRETRLVGAFPGRILQLENITKIDLGLTSLNMEFPPSIGPKLQHIGLLRTNVNSTLPDTWNWSQLDDIIWERNRLKCPLPLGLVKLFQNDTVSCSADMNQLWIDENSMLCGQVPISTIKCQILPYVAKPRIFTQNQETPAHFFKADFNDIQLEFDPRENIAYIFAAKNSSSSTGSRLIRRSPYVAFHFQPYVETSGVEPLKTKRVFNASRFHSAERLSATEFRINGTFTHPDARDVVFQQQLLWTASPGDLNQPNILNNIKFSLYIQSSGYAWVGSKFNFMMNVLYQAAHSPSNGTGRAIRCLDGYNYRDGIRYETCNSSIAELSAFVEPFGLSTRTVLRTPQGDINFGYNTNIKLNGSLLSSFSDVISMADRFFAPAAFARTFIAQSDVDDSEEANPFFSTFSELPESDQFVSVPLKIAVPIFSTFEYDPDVSLSLIFSDLEGEEGLAAGLEGGKIAAAIVVPILAVTLAIGGFILYKKVIFPYRNSQKVEKIDQQEEFDDQEEGKQKSPEARWTQTRPNQYQN